MMVSSPEGSSSQSGRAHRCPVVIMGRTCQRALTPSDMRSTQVISLLQIVGVHMATLVDRDVQTDVSPRAPQQCRVVRPECCMQTGAPSSFGEATEDN